MKVSRIVKLRRLEEELEHILNNFEKDRFDGAMTELASLVYEMAVASPLPQDDRQARPEMFAANNVARNIFQKTAIPLFRLGWFEKIYSATDDPAILSGTIRRGICSMPDDMNHELTVKAMKSAIDLGGVIAAGDHGKIVDIGNVFTKLNDPRLANIELGSVKKLLTNQFSNQWSIEMIAHDRNTHASYIYSLLGYIGSKDPAWATKFLIEMHDWLSEVSKGSVISINDPATRPIIECVSQAPSALILQEVEKVNPGLYEAFMNEPFVFVMLFTKMQVDKDFKISDFPLNENITEEMVLKLFSGCTKMGSLDQARLDDFEAAWAKFGYSGNLFEAVKKSEAFQSLSQEIRDYSDLVLSPDVTPEMIFEKKGNFRFVNQNFEFIDKVFSGKLGLPSSFDSPGHSAYMIASFFSDKEIMNNAQVSTLSIGTALLLLKNSSFYDAPKELLRRAFQDQVNFDETAKISFSDFESAKKHVKNLIDDTSARKINWVDPAIKASLISEDLGI